MTTFNFTRVKTETVFNRGTTSNIVATFDVATEAPSGLAENDIITGISAPKFGTITGYYLIFDELDTDASPTGTFDLGDTDVADRFLSGVAMGGALTHYAYDEKDAPAPAAFVSSGDTLNTPSNGVGFTYTDNGTIQLLVSAAVVATATSGQLVLVIEYTDNAV